MTRKNDRKSKSGGAGSRSRSSAQGGKKFKDQKGPERPLAGGAKGSAKSAPAGRPTYDKAKAPRFEDRSGSDKPYEEGRHEKPRFEDRRSSDRPYEEGRREKPRFDRSGRGPRPSSRRRAPGKPRSADGSIRLNRFLANAGLASRREADELIKAGLVQINGSVVQEMGYQVKTQDEVRFNGSLVRREKKVYYVLNKPKGFISTVTDPKARKTVMDLMVKTGPERIYPVGRLDRQTTGVLLFTNDGDLAKKLTHPSHGARKIYDVTLDNNLDLAHFHAIQEGLELKDGPIKVDEIQFIEGKDRKHVGVVLHSGRNRIVRRLFQHLGYEVTKLDRVSFAGITKKNLQRGHWRKLNDQELSFLQMV